MSINPDIARRHVSRLSRKLVLLLIFAASYLSLDGAASASPGGRPHGANETAAARAPLTASAHGIQPQATATACPLGWQLVDAPNEGTAHPHAVAAAAPDDAWGAGYVIVPGGEQTTIIHWDGREWAGVPSPNPGPYSKLNGLAVERPDSVWAVGSYGTNSSVGSTMILHWDGARWAHVPSPNPSGVQLLNGVEVAGPGDVWAVGNQANPGTPGRTLILRKTGGDWVEVPGPNVIGAGNNVLQGVSAAGPNDVWAVGRSFHGQAQRTMTMHWDGTGWTIVPSPAPGNSSMLFSVSAIAADDVWAVGSFADFAGQHTLTMHWDGTAWTVVPSPDALAQNDLWGVDGWSADDVWAVGLANGPGNQFMPLALHWDGVSWTNAGALYDPNTPVPYHFHSVDAIGPRTAWAGGELGVTVVQYHGPLCSEDIATATSTARATSTPVPANTQPATSTATASPARPSPTGSATPCAVSFGDAPPGSPFHPFVQCLACKGILGGYEDGTFRPNNHVTRGQLAKIVANAAGYDENPGGQSFSDVPPGSPFYPFVERLARRDIIAGYADGTFRPVNGATRGQIAKIVANAAGYGETPVGQTFADVPPDSPFYLFIERLARRNIIGGYADGTFRPGNEATRGQTSKIVGNAFFPGCGPVRYTGGGSSRSMTVAGMP